MRKASDILFSVYLVLYRYEDNMLLYATGHGCEWHAVSLPNSLSILCDFTYHILIHQRLLPERGGFPRAVQEAQDVTLKIRGNVVHKEYVSRSRQTSSIKVG